MMLDSPHTSVPVSMRGNALVFEKHLLKMPLEPVLRNTCHGPRTSLPQRALHPTDHVQHDIHPTANERQPATVCAEERGLRGTTSSRTTTGAAPKLSPPKSDAVLRTSTRGTVPNRSILPQVCLFERFIWTAGGCLQHAAFSQARQHFRYRCGRVRCQKRAWRTAPTAST